MWKQSMPSQTFASEIRYDACPEFPLLHSTCCDLQLNLFWFRTASNASQSKAYIHHQILAKLDLSQMTLHALLPAGIPRGSSELFCTQLLHYRETRWFHLAVVPSSYATFYHHPRVLFRLFCHNSDSPRARNDMEPHLTSCRIGKPNFLINRVKHQWHDFFCVVTLRPHRGFRVVGRWFQICS